MFSLLAIFKLSEPKKKEVFRITENSLFYNSTLGEIGEIPVDYIDFIDLVKTGQSKTIRIGIKEDFDIASKLSKFRQRMRNLYLEKSGADILIFPQDTDLEISELTKLLKDKLNK